MMTCIDFPQLATAEGEQKTGGANAGNPMPVIRNANAVKFGFATKLIPVLVDGVQTAWEEMHVNSKVTEVRRISSQAQRAAGRRIAFVDYDPIMDGSMQRVRFRPVWTGD